MEATGKIISIMTRWLRYDAVLGYQSASGKEQERQSPEVPVGFKWFVEGLHDGSLGFAGEESAGASFVRLDGTVWTTDKDGMVPALLAAEMTARMGRDPRRNLP